MSGIQMRFTLDDGALARQIDALIARGSDLHEPLDDIGQDMVSISLRAFEESRTPEGVPWEPSAAATREGRKTLIKRGLRGGLMGSFSYIVGSNGVTYGTNMVHAAIHQFGGEIQTPHARREAAQNAGTGFGQALAESIIVLPARAYVGASDTDQQRWADTIADYLAAPAGGPSVGGAPSASHGAGA